MSETRNQQLATPGSYQTWSAQGGHQTNMKADACALATADVVDDYAANYIMWQPNYRKTQCEANGFVNCSVNADRFGPRQVTQESFLQGRGQVTSNPGCTAGFVNYLPESEFSKPSKPKASGMQLFAQPTTTPKSCGTLSEVDLQDRMQKLPGSWQGSWSPFSSLKLQDGQGPTMSAGTLPKRQTVTLGTSNKYPEWPDLKKNSEPYSL